jgi:hypothetical protein
MTALTLALLLSGNRLPEMSSGELISKCLAKYAAANSGIGEFTMTQTAGGKKVSIKTDLSFERPSKMFLHQSSEAVAPNDWLVVSDGVNFGYDAPGDRSTSRRRLFEPIAITTSVTGEKRTLKIHSIYMAAKLSLGDVPNPFLEFITQNTSENQSLKGYLERISKKMDSVPKEKELLDGTVGYSIAGQMWFGARLKDDEGKPTDKFESVGRYEMQISKDFDLVSMKTIETMSITDKSNNLPTVVNIVTTWAGKMQLNQTPSEEIFKVR